MSEQENSKVEIEAIKSFANENNGIREIIIRRGEALKLEPEPKPLPIKVTGLLINPYQYLIARKHLFEKEDCNLIVSKGEGSLTFTVNDRVGHKDIIVGKVTTSRALDQFGINEAKYWSDKELAKFFRRNKFYFADPDINATIVSALMKFEAKVNSLIEKNADLRGNMKNVFERTVESNIPESFIANIPVFEGYAPVKFEVFIGAEPNSQEVKLFLESPILFELIEKEKEQILNDNIKHFEEFGCAIMYV